MDNDNQSRDRFAGFWIRLAAYYIDGFILLIPILLISLLFGFSLEKISTKELPWFLTLLLVAIVWSYNVFFLTKYGATPGKKAFGMKVIGDYGKVIGLKSAVLRETIGKILSSLLFNLGYIWVAFDGKKQAWHDKIAGSYVILTQPLRGFKKFLAVTIPLILPAIAIIGIGALALLSTIRPTQQINQAQDAKIKSDIIVLQKAIEKHYADHQRVPYSLDDLVPQYIREIPRHPKTNLKYHYYPSANLLHYSLSGRLSSGEDYTVKNEPL